ncbi:TRAP-type C4-dicarboxylate transport system, small permease component [Terribacillus aidingensis]|uniref:TRAP-type C4-dicarboxylate transport system, small permease component n=1 Tax=Terribacillus aidingensis TaxID=586416 RepID=A0A285P7D6_9BACI|nr:TRAP transporter small permease [Terribacillus aidingensis]SNZ17358.1 TRAP-type C4-dicarboxylate transport system, small permease component [Terribacillus aidingensis]
MEKIRYWVDKCILLVTCTLTVFLVAGAIWQVFTRFVLQNPSVFTEEVLRFSFIWVGLLGASYAFGVKEHIALTFLMSKWKHKKDKQAAEIIIEVTVLLFMIIVFIIGGSQLMLETMSQTSPVLGLPMGYVYAALPLSGLLTVYYTVTNRLMARKEAARRRHAA